MSLKMKNSYASMNAGRTKSADQSSAERSTKGENTNSLYQNGYTVLVSNELYDNPLTIRGVQRTQRGFLAVFFDKEGNKVNTGHVSPASLVARLCPNTNDAVGAFLRVDGIDAYDTPKAFAEANMSGAVCVMANGTKPSCRPVWDDTTERYKYTDMVKQDYTVFKIVPMPEKVKSELFEG